MAHVRSTTRSRDDVPVAKGEGAVVERGVVDKGHDNVDSAERTKSAHVCNAGSQSHAEGEFDGGSCIHSCYFGPSTAIIARIRKMIDQRYFSEGGAHAPVEDTIPKPESDEVVVFEEFFTVGLRMLPHPVLADILLKF
jgi:hypothetical protein